MMMKAVLASVLSLYICTPALAGNGAWTLGWGQGTAEAIVENANGSSVNIYCPSGQDDRTPGMFVQSKKVTPAVKERVTVQFVVDGKRHPFEFDEIQFLARTKDAMQDLVQLQDALIASRQKSFTVEFPKYNVVETFSLRDARKTLGGKSTLLSDCAH
jgi:hypothetical protein